MSLLHNLSYLKVKDQHRSSVTANNILPGAILFKLKSLANSKVAKTQLLFNVTECNHKAPPNCFNSLL